MDDQQESAGDGDGHADDTTAQASGNANLAQNRDSQISPLAIDLQQNIFDSTRVFINAGQEIHVLTRDRIELALRKSLPRYTDLGALLSKVGIFLALLLAIITTDTKAIMGISKEAWTAVIVILTLVSGTWALVGTINYFRRNTIEDIVTAVVKSADE